MAQIIQNITVEVSKPNFFQAIVAKQYDSDSRFLKATFVHGSEKINVLPTSTVTINAKRNDGGEKSFTGVVNADGTVTVPLTYWILELNGTVECDISVIDTDGRKLTSTKFIVEVERASCANVDASETEKYDVIIIQAKDLAAATNPFRRRITGDENLDNITDPGVYYYITEDKAAANLLPANAPFENAAIIEVIATDAADQRIIQRATRYGESGHTKERVLSNNGKWLDWMSHPLFMTIEQTSTSNGNGNVLFTLKSETMIIAVRAIPTSSSVSACVATPYWSTSYSSWGVHISTSAGETLANTEVNMTVIYTKKG